MSVAIDGEGVLIGAGSGVVGLTGVAEDADEGREADEEVEGGWVGESGVEVPGSGDLGEDGGIVVAE